MAKYHRKRKSSRFSRRSRLRKVYRKKSYGKKRMMRKRRGFKTRSKSVRSIKRVINSMAEHKSVDEAISGFDPLAIFTTVSMKTSQIIPNNNSAAFDWRFPGTHPYAWNFYMTTFMPMKLFLSSWNIYQGTTSN